MTDTFTLLGTTFNNVAGFRAKDSGGTMQTFTQGGGGASNFVLLTTLDMGTISTTSTTATDTGKTITINGINDYDGLIVVTAVETQVNNRHVATARIAWLNATSNMSSKTGATLATATWNVKLSSGNAQARTATTAYGVYPNTLTASGSTATAQMYQRFNSTNTGNINGHYIAKVYGIKLWAIL